MTVDKYTRKNKNRQLKKLLTEQPTAGRVKEARRLAEELQLGPGDKAKLATWERLGPETFPAKG